MRAKVVRRFKGRKAGSQECTTYKVGDIIEDPRVAAAALRSGNAEPLTGKVAPENKAGAPPENKAAEDPAAAQQGAAAGQPARDPRAPAPQPAPLRPGRGR